MFKKDLVFLGIILAIGLLIIGCQRTNAFDPIIDSSPNSDKISIQEESSTVSSSVAAVKCSSFITGNEAFKAADGDTSTYWMSQPSSPQWLNIDFGYSKDFNQIKIFWGACFAKKFTINISSDGAVWTTVYTGGAVKYGWQVITLSPTMKWARYVGVYCYNRAQSWGNQIVEFKAINASYYSYSLDSSGKKVVTNPVDTTVLANKDRNLDANFIPPDLVVPNVTFPFPEYAEKKNMRKEAAGALENLFAAAKANGLTLVAVSGYRSYSTQQVIFNNKVAAVGWNEAVKVSAQPGQSEHQTGWAMDVSCWSQGGNLTTAFGNTPEGLWLANNCYNYGFIIRYQLGKESITGYSYEPWHIRYVGVEHAKAVKSSNLTLDEYISKIANY